MVHRIARSVQTAHYSRSRKTCLLLVLGSSCAGLPVLIVAVFVSSGGNEERLRRQPNSTRPSRCREGLLAFNPETSRLSASKCGTFSSALLMRAQLAHLVSPMRRALAPRAPAVPGHVSRGCTGSTRSLGRESHLTCMRPMMISSVGRLGVSFCEGQLGTAKARVRSRRRWDGAPGTPSARASRCGLSRHYVPRRCPPWLSPRRTRGVGFRSCSCRSACTGGVLRERPFIMAHHQELFQDALVRAPRAVTGSNRR